MKCLILTLILGTVLPLQAAIHIHVEHATTRDQLCWGLMQRDSLEENHGMLFHYPTAKFQRVWMFNCLIPLSIAFLDEDGRILEIQELVAYPEMMKGYGEVDLNRLRFNDPVVKFFFSESKVSRYPVKFSLEMASGWFREHGVAEGDIVLWENSQSEAKVLLRK